MDAVLAAVQARAPGTSVDRLVVTHPGDDDNLWFISRHGIRNTVQLESRPDHEPPFLIEDDDGRAVTALTIQGAVDAIEAWLMADQ